MPGIVAHHTFGIDVYDSCSRIVGNVPDVIDAFLLGNLGPDPFFYLMASPSSRSYRHIGQDMHKRCTPELLFAMHEYFIENSQGSAGAARTAYALGFLCHYLLDSGVHPLVYAQQDAICNPSIAGLSNEWSQRVAHATIETAFDERILTKRFGATVATMPPHKTMLRCSSSALITISSAYAPALKNTYGESISQTAFVSAVTLNRLAQQALDSRGRGLRQHFDFLSGLGMASAYIQALSLRNAVRMQTPFANDDHVAWKVPYSDGAVVSQSFDDLFSQALRRAQEVLPAYVQSDFSLNDCRDLVDDVNFLGRTVEP